MGCFSEVIVLYHFSITYFLLPLSLNIKNLFGPDLCKEEIKVSLSVDVYVAWARVHRLKPEFNSI